MTKRQTAMHIIKKHYFKSALQDKITKLNSKYIPDWGTINFVLGTLGGVNTLDSGSLLDNLGDLRSNCELSINVLFDLEVIILFYIRASIYQRFQFQIKFQKKSTLITKRHRCYLFFEFVVHNIMIEVAKGAGLSLNLHVG